MDAFFQSLVFVTLGEMGDKTQLLSIFLAARFRRPLPIIAGILGATLLNHGISVWIGHFLGNIAQSHILQYTLAGLFIILGLWILKPDDLEGEKEPEYRYGAFLTTLVIFFFAEIGDKTQAATIALGATYPDEFWSVLTGTTLGMLVADIPAVFLGEKILKCLPLKWFRWISATFFIGFGLLMVAQIMLRLC